MILTTTALALVLAAAPPSEFASEVQAGFSVWDSNRDGLLTPNEVEWQIADPRVKGRAAAALAAIQTYQSGSDGKKRPLLRDTLLREATAETAKEVQPPFEPRFADALARIERANRVLFGPGAPGLDDVRQGHIGDCFFVAVVGAVADRRPSDVRGWIVPQGDGSHRVRFPLGANAGVRPLTDAQIALTSFAGKQGLWINVLEQGFGQIMRRVDPNPTQGLALDAIAFGGTPVQTMRMMTANEAAMVNLRPADQKTPPTEAQLSGMMPQLRAVLRDAHANKRIACAGSPNSGLPPDVTPTHAYAVLGYDADRDVVKLWNPHGNTFQPAGPPGLTNGYATRHGRFELPLADFARVFCFLAYETGQSIRLAD